MASAISVFAREQHLCVAKRAQPVPLASLKLSMAVYGRTLDGRPSRRRTKTAYSAVLRKGRSAMDPMPGCGMHSRPKLAEKPKYNSLVKIK